MPLLVMDFRADVPTQCLCLLLMGNGFPPSAFRSYSDTESFTSNRRIDLFWAQAGFRGKR